MKGIVFTRLLDMIEEQYGLEVVDELVEETKLASQGAYTSVGTYDHIEILALINNLSKKVNIPTENLITAYGEYLFPNLMKIDEETVSQFKNTFALLAALDNIIHPEVLKLYPDAELPRFETKKHDNDELILIYSSCRPFAYLAKGLIKGCMNHFNECINISLEHQDTEGIYSSVITLKRINA